MENEQTPQQRTKAKELSGTVVSAKMDKTAVVEVNRYVRHPKYKKYRRLRKRYKVHDPNNEAVVGAQVRIREMPRVSRHKAFRLL